ncbi:MAG: hypothetical protein RMK51_11810 [Meiothermus sp.]|uniref:hypothetical protein n=1 Tax=Meiothermus sp. TaxID=1955249 RepID=UPI00298F0746|nr:hypothetical protein [Meiothermus sp.]MDW8426609.1 hypothetical protein [Meiothermus sp.]
MRDKRTSEATRNAPGAWSKAAARVPLSAVLLVVSLELGLRGVLMYWTPGLSADSLVRFNLSPGNLCTGDGAGSAETQVEHGPLCFVHLLPAEELSPTEGRFASLRFAGLPPATSVPAQTLFLKSLAARAPPL